ncbi:Uncharacterised protein [Arcanobacterium haemolyticum]|uniref:hypothetical protein n=1 Tax=Arcanobacterium haemolyticum TaxID=28264 RepID=UPI000D95D86F|nr:hypothetical protein [Arcanobacterium haemolyticum]SPT75084.1 Uncharacterised protein [Arcanobacterium haemolyticum]
MKKALTLTSFGSLLLAAMIYVVFASPLVSGTGFPFLPMIIAFLLTLVGIAALNALLVTSTWNSESRNLTIAFLLGEFLLLLALYNGVVNIEKYPSMLNYLAGTPLSAVLSIAGITIWLGTLGMYTKRSR